MPDFDKELFIKLTNKVDAITKDYIIAESESSNARRVETALLNDLNEAQKELGLCIEAMKANAPNSSDWKRTSMRSHGGAV